MANNITVAIKADVADLVAKRAIMSAELKTATKDLNAFAREAASTGSTDELRTSMLEAADAVAKTKNQIASLDAESRKASGNLGRLSSAQQGTSATGRVLTMQMSQVVQQSMAGTSVFQALAMQLPDIAVGMSMAGGEAGTMASILGGPWGIAAASAVALAIPLVGKMFELGSATDSATAKLRDQVGTVEDLTRARTGLLAVLNQPANQQVMDAMADSERTLRLGESNLEKLKGDRAKVQPFVDDDEKYNRRDSAARTRAANLDRQIAAQEQALATERAAIALQKARLQEANAAKQTSDMVDFAMPVSGKATGAFGEARPGHQHAGIDIAVPVGTQVRAPAAGKIIEAGTMPGYGNVIFIDHGGGTISRLAHLSSIGVAKGDVVDKGSVLGLSGGAKGAAGSGDSTGPHVHYEVRVNGKAVDPRRGSFPVDAMGADAKGGTATGQPSQVQQWTQQLHSQQIASKEFLRDQTADEAKFWQDKLALTKQGSREWIEVQDKIYAAQKRQAQQGYQDQLADLNMKLEADRGNWSAEEADWEAKLAYIRGALGEQSSEYKTAYRDFIRAQRQHDDDAARIQAEGQARALQSLKSHLDAMQSVKESDERTRQQAVSAGISPVSDVSGAVESARRREELDQQALTDSATVHAAEAAMNDAAVQRAAERYGVDSQNYQAALDAKREADERYADEKARLEARVRANSIQSIVAVQGAYHNYIDGMVGATSSGLVRSLVGTQRWGQSARGIYTSVLGTIEQKVQQVVANWIVQHVLMTAAQRAQLAIQTGAHVAAEGAKTAATAVGEGARVATTAAGASAAGAITGAHNLKEITSHAATAAAAAYHAMAGIPVIGPFLGAAAAATTFAAVEAFGVLASFDKGANVIPSDMVAQIHAGERIIPAADNRQMMQMMQRGAEGGGSNRGGDTFNMHYNPTVNGHMPFWDQLARHERNLFDMIRRGVRRGALKVA